MTMLTFLIGGARSGKSTLAVQMGQRYAAERAAGAVHFIATAEPFDDDLRERINRHRSERPLEWTTAEVPVHLADAVRAAPADMFLIIDCLTVWLANLLVHVPQPAARAQHIDDVVGALGERAAGAKHAGTPTVVVSNEVGMGVHPETELGRSYRDELGRTNQMVAAVADQTLLLVAGRAVTLSDPWELLR